MSTIAALATAPGLGGVAIIRISGPETYAIADALVHLQTPPSKRAPGTFLYTTFLDADGSTMDDGLMLFFRAPQSYTGEDVVELHVHGGAVVPQRILERLYTLGARPAEPGEFTKRAFLNGRMDLTQAEAVADIIAARSPRAERSARAALQGELGRTLEALYLQTLSLATHVEHLLDFDEGELPSTFYTDTLATLGALSEKVTHLLSTWHEGRLLREGARVVLAGKPNAGKSSLFNLLLGCDRAIVNATAGTTRDFIEETFLLDGIPIRLTDTAGLRDTDDQIEREGVTRAQDLLARADATLYLISSEELEIRSEECPTAAWSVEQRLTQDSQLSIPVITKSDLLTPLARRSEAETANASRLTPHASVPAQHEKCQTSAWREATRISVHADPEGTKATICALLRDALKLTEGRSDGILLATARQYAELSTAERALAEATAAFHRGDIGYVPAAGFLREAAEALGRILGKTYANDLLDSIFSHFCVGK